LFPTALRIARALDIPSDEHSSESFFQQQMRRRLWYTICSLDGHTSIDRASQPLISPMSTQPKYPLNINETDFGPSSVDAVSEREEPTDMSPALLLYNVQRVGKIINWQEDSNSSSGAPNHLTMVKKQQTVQEFEQFVQKLLKHCNPNSNSLSWCIFHGALSALAGTQLALRRPMRLRRDRPVTLDSIPTQVLRLSTTMLYHDALKRLDPRGEPFRWFGAVQWYPLAVAIAESYACKDVNLLRHTWPIVEKSYAYMGDLIAGKRKGMLWKPIENLMIKTRPQVNSLLQAENKGFATTKPTSIDYTTASNPDLYSSLTSLTSDLDLTDLDTADMASPFDLLPSPWVPLSAAGSEATRIPEADLTQATYDQLSMDFLDPGWEVWDDLMEQLDFNANSDSVTK
jgi:hypothetical protein